MQHQETCYDGYVRDAAVMPASAIVDLVNTLDVSTGEDLLADVGGLAKWMRARGLLSRGVQLAERDLRIAVELRERLRSTLLAHHDGGDDPAALQAISDLTFRQPIGLRFDHGVAQLATDGPGVATLVAAVADAIVALQHDGQWQRVRICPSDDCLEAFHDTSRGGTRRWCSMGVCGNRTKVTSYRQRTRPT